MSTTENTHPPDERGHMMMNIDVNSGAALAHLAVASASVKTARILLAQITAARTSLAVAVGVALEDIATDAEALVGEVQAIPTTNGGSNGEE